MMLFPSVPTSPAGVVKGVYFHLRREGECLELRHGPGLKHVATIEPSPGELEWLGDCAKADEYSIYSICTGLLLISAKGAEPPKFHIEDPAWHTVTKDGRIALIPTDGTGPSMLELDIDSVELIARTWREGAVRPEATEFTGVLDHLRILHRCSMYNPQGVLQQPWSTPCRLAEYQRPMIAMWDTLHIALDLAAMGEEELAKCQLLNHYALQHRETGQMAQDCIPVGVGSEPPKDERDELGRGFGCSQPPLWAPVTYELMSGDGDVDSLKDIYPMIAANLMWWEGERQDPATGLFYWAIRGESGADNTPRFGAALKGTPVDGSLCGAITSGYGAADLSAQMHLSYEATAAIASRIGEDGSRWTRAAKSLAGAMNAYLWSEVDGLYLDYDFGLGDTVGPRTAFGFFPLITGAPGAERAERMIETLTDPASFWRELPVPTVAVDEECYSQDMWRGPVWLSLNLWIARGLIRWGRRDLASELARRSLRRAEAVFDRQGCVLEYYPADGMRVAGLRRKGDSTGPHRYYIGHAPLFALAQLL